MAISKYGMPNRLGDVAPINSAGRPNAAQALKPPTPGQPQALPPAGLPPDAWAMAKMPTIAKKPIVGRLGASLPRQVTPSAPNAGQQLAKLDQTQVSKQLSPETVMGMDSDKWARLLAEFGVFA